MVNKIDSDDRADRLNQPDRSQEPTALAPEFPESPGDRERGKFRPSFWRRLTQVAVSNDDGSPVTQNTDKVLRDVLAKLADVKQEIAAVHAVNVSNGVSIAGKTFQTPPLGIPGIGVASAYADLDAFGTEFRFTVPESGIIQTAAYCDLDDEGLMMDVWLYRKPISTQTADNSPLVFPDKDLPNIVAVISFSNFKDGNTGQVAIQSGLGIAYSAPEGVLYGQFQARGAVNIAGGALPLFSLTILSD